MSQENLFFNLTFKNNNNDDDSLDPEFEGWLLTEFDDIKLVFLLTFKNPLHISQGKKKDQIIIEYLEPRIF